MSEPISLITLHQPRASCVAERWKKMETRGNATKWRGLLAIHAADRALVHQEMYDIAQAAQAAKDTEFPHDWMQRAWRDGLPLGAIVALARLTRCLFMVPSEDSPTPAKGVETILIPSVPPLEIAMGIWSPGRWAWELEDIIALPEPIPFKGWQGIRPITDEAVLEQLWAVAA